MSALKRKNGPEAPKAGKDNPAKRTKTDTPEKKRAKAAKGDKSQKQNGEKPSSTTTTTTAPQTAKSSVLSFLKDEEPMFPRGGGSVLTPLEQKQIQMEAKADAIDEDELEEASKPKTKTVKERRSSKKSEKQKSHPVRSEDSVRVESLNPKRLVKGSLVLGQIVSINALDIDVALPNNLTGHIAITAISDALTARLQNLEGSDNEDDDNEDSADQDVDLASLFVIGQYVRACVLSTSEETVSGKHTKSKRRIELSLRPSDTNPGLSSDDIVTSTSLMATVLSVEDHGCVMDIGQQGVEIRGFMPTKEIDPSIEKGRLQAGNAFLCLVTGRSPNKRVVQLTTLSSKLGSLKALPYDATTINTFLPGSAVEVLVTEVTWGGVVGKVLGHLDVTADLVHSGVATDSVDLESVYKVGSKIKARVICNFATAQEPKLGISLLPHVLHLTEKSTNLKRIVKNPLETYPISKIVEKCVVKKVETGIGLFVDIGLKGFRGFVHISRVKDGKVDSLYESSGPYKVDTEHRGRILGYNPVDGLFHLSFEQSVLDKKYLRLEDIPIGAVVSCTVEAVVIGPEGVKGLVVKLPDGMTGFITDRHLSDVQLQNPEKKFREGMTVKARVLSIDLVRRQMRLTLKKTLVNSDAPVIKSFDDVSLNMQVPGTITKVMPNGASIQFYGSLRGFLPRSEMSEAFIRNPEEHFRAGQVVNLHVIEVDAEANRLVVSCKDPSSFGVEKQTALKEIEIGELVSGKIMEKTEDIILELEGSGLKATLPVGHLTDKSIAKCKSEAKRLRVGQTLSGLMVIDKHDRRRAIALTRKPSLIEAQKQGKLLQDASSAKVGDVLAGYVRDVIPAGVLVQFGGSARALLPKSRIPADAQEEPDFGMTKLQSLSVKLVSVIQDQGRLVAALPSPEDAANAKTELTVGTVTTATIASIRGTQLNVRLGEGQQQHGRVDMSELFDKFEDIPDPKEPLASYKQGDVLTVRVLGTHDARNHRFLPISHRGSSHQVLELTARPSAMKAEPLERLTIDKVKVGSEHVAFVNTAAEKYIWVNLSPFVRSRINGIDISDDVSALADIPNNFPVGSAIKVHILSVNAETGRVDVSANRLTSTSSLTWDDIKANAIVAGRVTKANERQVLVQLSDSLAGPVHLPDLADDYAEAKPLNYKKNDIVKVSVVEVDKANKRLRLSTRPSRILNSAAAVADREITSVSQISTGDIVRGFVKSVSDVGLFILLGGNVVAHVKIANLSDKFLQKWKDSFQVDQLVKGRVLSVDEGSGRIEMSLKESAVEKDFVPLKTFHDLKAGQILTGTVRKVESFGAFIEIDHSANVRGLCHKSEMAETPVADPQKLYSEGDAVKVYVVSVDIEKKRVNFGLKPSYFDSESESEDAADSDSEMEDVPDDREPVDHEMEDVSATVVPTVNDDDSDDSDDEGGAKLGGLEPKHDWMADAFGDSAPADDDDPASSAKDARKTRKRARIEVDKTADMDVNGPQSASDYERLLMGQPDSSDLWIAYMALQMQVSELTKAREIAERALRTINVREETEKLNVWIAYLNLEMAYGSKDTLEEVFKRACQYNDEQEVHERLASIYIRTGKHKEADELFQKTVKKFGAKAPQLWVNYAHFLSTTLSDPARARALLPRAHQSLDAKHHVATSVRFAALEWRSPKGDPEKGRTLFEGILAKFPKKGDVWRQLLDLEIGAGADEGVIRDVFERRAKVGGLKPVQAMKWFETWGDWEGERDEAKKEDVKKKAADWVRAYKARQAAKQAEEE
ncbi:related to ribosomal RNA processing protein RRP5 [Cephalotrichum gorgonifer]|uniref:rRNA biogenesis protein RRP5 n=1 Tax=Cephalotrichum gorgonifer TaxID=2041049 RepID=A0AAE8MY79_9PEZI|nr:related to ribosomal RNA processing protein RRP5 [Cephalotrichum gorgonifer]